MRKLLTICGLAVGMFLLAPAAHAQAVPGEPYSCSVDNVGNSLTVCMAAKGERRFWITQIIAQSTTATGGQFILQYGTGTACGTGTTSLFPANSSAVRLGYPGYAIAPTVIPLNPPIAAPKEKDLCALGVATNTLVLVLNGYLAP